MKTVCRMDPVPGCSFILRILQERTLYEAETGSLHLLNPAHYSDSASALGRSCQLLKKKVYAE